MVRLVLVLIALGLVGMGGWHWATRWRPSPEVYSLQGVDLPSDAPTIDWGSVRAAGADFAYLTATSGGRSRAPHFEANWQALPEAGLRRGAVHDLDPCADGRAQADAFNAVVPRAADALPAVAAIMPEGDCAPAEAARAVRAFVTTVETHLGKPVILRLSRAAEGRWRLARTLDRPVWVTANLLRPNYIDRPWRLWRASDMRRVDGVERPMNWNVVAP